MTWLKKLKLRLINKLITNEIVICNVALSLNEKITIPAGRMALIKGNELTWIETPHIRRIK